MNRFLRSKFSKIYLAFGIANILNIALFSLSGKFLNDTNFVDFAASWTIFFLLLSPFVATELDSNMQAHLSSTSRDTKLDNNVTRKRTYALIIIVQVFAFCISLDITKNKYIAFLVVLGVFAVYGLSIIRGESYIAKESTKLARVVLVESLIRFSLVYLLLVTFGLRIGNEIALVACSSAAIMTFLSFAIATPNKQTLVVKGSLSNVFSSAIGNLLNSIAIVGLPWAIAVFSEGSAASKAAVIELLTISRLPLILFSVIQGFLLPHVGSLRDLAEVWIRMVKAKKISSFLFVTGACVFIFVGPKIVSLVFSSNQQNSHATFSILVLANLLLVLTSLIILNAIANRDTWLPILPWIFGIIATIIFLKTISESTLSIACAVLLGALVSLCVALLLSLNEIRISEKF